jgi:cell division transport system ATP-binding protein
VIELYHVYQAYGDQPPSLFDLNLRVDKGEFVFLTGPSGAGKTTLLKLLFCAEQPTRGQILLGGKNIAQLRRSQIPHLRRNIGVVFQDFKLLEYRTVAENVAYALEVQGLPARLVREKVLRILQRVGLDHKADVLPMLLSGGEQQRVVIARALVSEPALLLADEPTGNLDRMRTLEIMDLLCDVNVRGTTVIVATHDFSLLERYPRRAVHLEDGRIRYDDDALRIARRLAAG